MSARRAPGPKIPTPVERIRHSDKRTNLPTADAHDFVTPEIEAPRTLRYQRDAALDPQLVWTGKDEQNSHDLVVDAPPIFIQEKIDPRVLIENLRKTSETDGSEPELTMFDVFDGLDEYEAVDFYRHAANWSNRMILGDSLQVMGSLADRENMRGQVQMCFLDPPYGISFKSNFQPSQKNRDVKDGKIEHVTRDAEMIKAFRDTWALGIHSYLPYLRDRLVAVNDLLHESGSVFVQISIDNVHLVRCLLDEVFGSSNFVSQISFVTTSGFTQAKGVGRAGDYLLWYAKDIDRVKTRPLWYEAKDRQGYNFLRLLDGTSRSLTKAEKNDPSLIPDGARIYTPGDLQSQGAASSPQPFVVGGKTYLPAASAHWKASYPAGMERLKVAGRVHVAKNSIRYVRFPDDFGWKPFTNNWTDTATGNFTAEKIYVVQTSTKVIERCILLTTDPGDLVLDPTCGSGSTASAAEQWGRRWITVDTSRVALALARQRLMAAKYPFYLLTDSDAGRKKEEHLSGAPSANAIPTNDIRHGFVYSRVPHIMLQDIANNPDIRSGMTQVEIDAAIERHTQYELLYDQPIEDDRKVRVAGPFTVESLSPHRAASFSNLVADAAEEERPTLREPFAVGDEVTNNESFEQMILANLASAGIQNGRRSERMRLDTPEPYPGSFIQSVALQAVNDQDETPLRVGLALGPQYGTVSPRFVKDAAREAIAAGNIDVLAVLAFAFDPAASGVKTADGGGDVTKTDDFAEVAASKNLGRLPVLFVRMNADLLMGEELKKTSAGNMFMVFGEPDIDVKVDGDQVVVELLGVDIYDPNTGEVRSNDTSQIALWMIDTDYDSESFFVRECYFTGGNKPYEQLARTLKTDIDADAWESLYSTTSRSFAKPTTGRIAVKVINDYGDEVVKIISVDDMEFDR